MSKLRTKITSLFFEIKMITLCVRLAENILASNPELPKQLNLLIKGVRFIWQ